MTVAANAAGTTLDNTAAATVLANAIVLNPSANLTVAGSNPLTLAGTISGDGALTKNGASTLILTADNSYAGGTTINTGTLQVGDGGASGSLGTGPVLDDAALVFNRSGTVAVPGAITGTGSLTQEGVAGGTLVLTGANTYSGGTTIASGVLQLGDGGTSGSIVGDVTNSGALAFDRSDTMTFAGVDLRHRGGGADRLRHDHSDRRQHLPRRHDDRGGDSAAWQWRHDRQHRRRRRRQWRARLRPQRCGDLPRRDLGHGFSQSDRARVDDLDRGQHLFGRDAARRRHAHRREQ